LARAYDASKAIVSDRLALMRLDAGRYASRLVIGAALLVVGVVLVVGSWFGLIVGFVLWMGVQWGAMLSLPVRLVIAAGVTLVAATVAMAIGVGAARKPAAPREQLPRPATPDRRAH
jgi:polyferredoxin